MSLKVSQMHCIVKYCIRCSKSCEYSVQAENLHTVQTTKYCFKKKIFGSLPFQIFTFLCIWMTLLSKVTFYQFMHSLGFEPAMTLVLLCHIFLHWFSPILLWLNVPVGMTQCSTAPWETGENIPLVGCVGITKAEEYNLHTTAPHTKG